MYLVFGLHQRGSQRQILKILANKKKITLEKNLLPTEYELKYPVQIFTAVYNYVYCCYMLREMWHETEGLRMFGCHYICLFFSIDAKVSVIDDSSPFASAYNLDNIIGSYQDRNCKLTKGSCFL